VLRFGIARVHSVSITRFADLCSAISRTADVKLAPTDVSTYTDLADSLAAGDIAVAWVPPITAADLCERRITDALAFPFRGGQLTYHTAFVMKRGMTRPIEKLAGTRIAWVDKHSASGYQVPRVHLSSLGFDPAKFFRSEIFVGSHLGVVDAVVNGRADVGATYVNLDPRGRVTTAAWTAPDGTPIRPIEIVSSAGPIPNDAIVATNALSGVERAQFVRFLLNPPSEHKPALRDVFSTTDFRLAKEGHFVPLRHMLRAAGARSGIRPSPVESDRDSSRKVR
jgi:phosphonate transport system substrate-binding protein